MNNDPIKERVTRFGTWTIHAQIRFKERFPNLDPDFELMQSIGHPVGKKRVKRIIKQSPEFRRFYEANCQKFDPYHYFRSPNNVVFVLSHGRVITAMAER